MRLFLIPAIALSLGVTLSINPALAGDKHHGAQCAHDMGKHHVDHRHMKYNDDDRHAERRLVTKKHITVEEDLEDRYDFVNDSVNERKEYFERLARSRRARMNK